MLISIFTPTHDSRDLAETYRSLLEQKDENWEWVIVPNGDNGAFQGQSTDIALAANYNKQILRSDPTGVFTPGKLVEFERGIPRWNGNLSLTHYVGDFDFMIRGTYYGEWL